MFRKKGEKDMKKRILKLIATLMVLTFALSGNLSVSASDTALSAEHIESQSYVTIAPLSINLYERNVRVADFQSNNWVSPGFPINLHMGRNIQVNFRNDGGSNQGVVVELERRVGNGPWVSLGWGLPVNGGSTGSRQFPLNNSDNGAEMRVRIYHGSTNGFVWVRYV
jgi:hypothetical protein